MTALPRASSSLPGGTKAQVLTAAGFPGARRRAEGDPAIQGPLLPAAPTLPRYPARFQTCHRRCPGAGGPGRAGWRGSAPAGRGRATRRGLGTRTRGGRRLLPRPAGTWSPRRAACRAGPPSDRLQDMGAAAQGGPASRPLSACPCAGISNCGPGVPELQPVPLDLSGLGTSVRPPLVPPARLPSPVPSAHTSQGATMLGA